MRGPAAVQVRQPLAQGGPVGGGPGDLCPAPRRLRSVRSTVVSCCIPQLPAAPVDCLSDTVAVWSAAFEGRCACGYTCTHVPGMSACPCVHTCLYIHPPAIATSRMSARQAAASPWTGASEPLTQPTTPEWEESWDRAHDKSQEEGLLQWGCLAQVQWASCWGWEEGVLRPCPEVRACSDPSEAPFPLWLLPLPTPARLSGFYYASVSCLYP